MNLPGLLFSGMLSSHSDMEADRRTGDVLARLKESRRLRAVIGITDHDPPIVERTRQRHRCVNDVSLQVHRELRHCCVSSLVTGKPPDPSYCQRGGGRACTHLCCSHSSGRLTSTSVPSTIPISPSQTVPFNSVRIPPWSACSLPLCGHCTYRSYRYTDSTTRRVFTSSHVQLVGSSSSRNKSTRRQPVTIQYKTANRRSLDAEYLKR